MLFEEAKRSFSPPVILATGARIVELYAPFVEYSVVRQRLRCKLLQVDGVTITVGRKRYVNRKPL